VAPSANVAVTNEEGVLLLIRRSDNDNWALPGGGLDLGESLQTGSARPKRRLESTARSRTCLAFTVTLDTSSCRPATAEVRQEFSVVQTVRATRGPPTPSGKTSEFRWVALDKLEAYEMDPSMGLRVQHCPEQRDQPHLG
jgi:ADP-ribose pyrophosphatase YjhB (NUDIX family)